MKKKKKKFENWPQIFVAIAALSTIFCAAYFLVKSQSANNSSAPGQLSNSESLPNLTLVSYQGKDMALGDMLAGNKNLLIFWATWCGPCVEEMKHMPELLPKLKAKGYAPIFLNYDPPEKKGIAEAFAQKNGITTAFDFRGEVLYALGLSMLPVSLVVDKSGKVLKTLQGELSETRL